MEKYNEALNTAKEIKTETTAGANTAAKVGGVIEDITSLPRVTPVNPLSGGIKELKTCKYVVFIFDAQQPELINANGRGGGFVSFKSMFDALGIKFDTSYTDYVAGLMTDAECLTLQSDGYEFNRHISASEAYKTGIDAYTEAEAMEWTKSVKDVSDDAGIITTHANYFGGGANPVMRSVMKRYFDSGATVGGGVNRKPITQYYLGRYQLDASSYNNMKDYFDNFLASTAELLIYYGHVYTNAWYTNLVDDDGNADAGGEYQWQKINKLLTYITGQVNYGEAENGLLITSMSHAINVHGNAVDIGDIRAYSDSGPQISDYFRITKTGQIGFLSSRFIPNYIGTNQVAPVGYDFQPSMDPDHILFREGEITVFQIRDNGGSFYSHTWPEDKGWVIVDKSQQHYDTFYGRVVQTFIGDKDNIYQRSRELLSTVWNDWENVSIPNILATRKEFSDLGGLVYSDIDDPTNSIFTDKTVVNWINGWGKAGDAPDVGDGGGGIGIVETKDIYNETWDNTTQHQIYYPRNNNNARMYIRYRKSDGTWYGWRRMIVSEKAMRRQLYWSAIPAHSTTEYLLDYYNLSTEIVNATAFNTHTGNLVPHTVVTGKTYLLFGHNYTAKLHNDTTEIITNGTTLKYIKFTAAADVVYAESSGNDTVIPGIVIWEINDLTDTGAKVGDAVIATPESDIGTNLMYNAYVKAANQVAIKIANISAASKTPTTAWWNMYVIKK